VTKDEALKLALEALENLLNQYYADTTTRNDLDSAEAAINVIRETLAEQSAQIGKPLTKEQITDLWNQKSWCVNQIEEAILFFTRCVEAAHGIKGEA
jgi:hypothetical protein